MRAIQCGTERAKLDQSAMQMLHDGRWSAHHFYRQRVVGLLLGGDAAGPLAHHLDLAKTVIPCFDLFVAESREYLSTFVDPTRFGITGEWELTGFACRSSPHVVARSFELTFQLGQDVHGLWSVTWSAAGSPDGFTPVAFGRAQS